MLGPSTPMVAEAFRHLPVHMLAGTVPIDKQNVLKAVRHGMGTPVLQKFSRKSFLYRQNDKPARLTLEEYKKRADKTPA
jgi:uncharacterized protein (DUF4213/DUF364 family)